MVAILEIIRISNLREDSCAQLTVINGGQVHWIGCGPDQLVDSIFYSRIAQKLGSDSVQGECCKLGSMCFHLLPVRLGGRSTLHLIDFIKVRFPVLSEVRSRDKARRAHHIPFL